MLTAVSVLSVAAGLLLIATVVLAVLNGREKKSADASRADKVKIVDGVRYSVNDRIQTEEGVNVTLAQGDFLLQRGISYRAEKGGALLPGTYTVLAASDAAHTFKLRSGGFVRDFHHGDTVVLAEGDEICAVSCTVILR